MALTLIKEDGTGLADANSYGDIADGDAYFDGHLYPSPWVLSASDRKEEALVMATRVIDAAYRFNGWRTSDAQALQWPRTNCPDPDKALSVAVLPLWWRSGNYVACNVVPKSVIEATLEMARELMLVDRTASPAGEGVLSTASGSGTGYSKTIYDKGDTRPIISPIARALLGRFGSAVTGRSGVVRLVRV